MDLASDCQWVKKRITGEQNRKVYSLINFYEIKKIILHNLWEIVMSGTKCLKNYPCKFALQFHALLKVSCLFISVLLSFSVFTQKNPEFSLEKCIFFLSFTSRIFLNKFQSKLLASPKEKLTNKKTQQFKTKETQNKPIFIDAAYM